MTKEEAQLIKKHLPLIETIIKNHSASNIPIEFREDMLSLGRKYKVSSCGTCSTGFYLTVSKLYNMYLEYENNTKRSKKADKGE